MTPENIANIFYQILVAEDPIDQNKEHFWSIGLDSANHIKYVELVSLGILNSSLVHPREVFRLAILEGVQSIIVGHNHPGDHLSPSPEDNKTMNTLRAAGEIIGIAVLDHIIIGNSWGTQYKNYYSWKEERS